VGGGCHVRCRGRCLNGRPGVDSLPFLPSTLVVPSGRPERGDVGGVGWGGVVGVGVMLGVCVMEGPGKGLSLVFWLWCWGWCCRLPLVFVLVLVCWVYCFFVSWVCVGGFLFWWSRFFFGVVSVGRSLGVVVTLLFLCSPHILFGLFLFPTVLTTCFCLLFVLLC